MTVDVERLQEERQQLLDGWEAATFLLRCAEGHEWGTAGLWHGENYWSRENEPTCPKCGLPWRMQSPFTGPNRPGVVEVDRVA